PTSAKDLARIILHLIKTNEYGTYHATCKGHCSRLEFAEEILKLTGKTLKLNPALAENIPTARPANAVLDNFILRIIDVYDMPTWQESLKEYLEA
ncbi:MAG: sugar nucleotide-binding protein, partial [Anaerotignum sp.]|nr:sugar nucleotide-binding protein [Anaerotignum sp.]